MNDAKLPTPTPPPPTGNQGSVAPAPAPTPPPSTLITPPKPQGGPSLPKPTLPPTGAPLKPTAPPASPVAPKPVMPQVPSTPPPVPGNPLTPGVSLQPPPAATPKPPTLPPVPPAGAAPPPVPTPPPPPKTGGEVPPPQPLGGTPTAPPTPPSQPGSIPGAGGNAPARFAKIKSSPLKFLPFILIGLVVVGVVGFIGLRFFGGGSSTPVTSGNANQGGSANNPAASAAPRSQTTITYWSLWEPCEVLQPVFSSFEEANPGILVNCQKQNSTDYRERLQTAIAGGSGPDAFRFHASWTPMLASELAAMPASVMSANEYKQSFYPVAARQLQNGGQIVGVPLMYDGLLLYYNEDMFQTAGIQPPQTWAEVREAASKLTVRSASGIERGGIALGTATNVEHYSDVLGLLMLQNGADLSDPASKEARDALTFYTNFATSDEVWDETLPSSTVAFARGDVAMMIAPSWRAHEVVATNPDLKFGVAGAPQLSETPITWASYWAEGVSAQSDNKDEAWQLLKYMSSAEGEKLLFAEQSKARGFGEPYSRVDLASEVASDEVLSTLLNQAPDAQSWYLNSFTFDNGLNDQIIKYYEDAINAILKGDTAEDVAATVDQGTNQVLRQFSVPSN